MVPAPGVLFNDADSDQDALTAILETDVIAGTLELASDGSFQYTAPQGFVGVVTFAYRATDAINVSNVAIVQITVE